MAKIFEITSGIATKEFTLNYDGAKDKYYLDICAYGDLWTETFYGKWALFEYLRQTWQFSDKQINKLLESVY